MVKEANIIDRIPGKPKIFIRYDALVWDTGLRRTPRLWMEFSFTLSSRQHKVVQIYLFFTICVQFSPICMHHFYPFSDCLPTVTFSHFWGHRLPLDTSLTLFPTSATFNNFFDFFCMLPPSPTVYQFWPLSTLLSLVVHHILQLFIKCHQFCPRLLAHFGTIAQFSAHLGTFTDIQSDFDTFRQFSPLLTTFCNFLPHFACFFTTFQTHTNVFH